MINFEKLDKNRIYLGLQFGKSLIANKIKKYSKRYCPNSKDVPTHALAFAYRHRLASWWVYEAHAKGFKSLGVPEGVRRYKLNLWFHIEEKCLEEFRAYPLDIDFENLENYVGQPYGIGDIGNLLKAALFKNNGKQKDRQGLTCGEYLALCYPAICTYFNLPACCITPAHFKDYVDALGILSTEGV